MKIEGVASGTPIPISGSISVTGTMPISVAAAAEVDGHSANIGALADASSANTLTGLLKNIKAALAGVISTTPGPCTTATLANVSGSASSVTLIASNAARLGFVIANDSTSILYIKYGSAASATSFTYMLGPTLNSVAPILESTARNYTGIITGIWASATGSARVTELTA